MVFDLLIVTTSDNILFEVDIRITDMSNLFKFLVEEWPDTQTIKVPIKGKIFEILVDYCKQHQFVNPECKPKPINETRVNYHSAYDDWELELLKRIKLKHLIDLMNAADYLEIESLVSFCAFSIAGQFSSKHGKVIQLEHNINKNFEDATDEIKFKYQNFINPQFNINRDTL